LIHIELVLKTARPSVEELVNHFEEGFDIAAMVGSVNPQGCPLGFLMVVQAAEENIYFTSRPGLLMKREIKEMHWWRL